MGLPPVVAGLIVYMLFSKNGIFGSLGLLFTVEVMVIAQCMLIIPVVINLTNSINLPPHLYKSHLHRYKYGFSYRLWLRKI